MFRSTTAVGKRHESKQASSSKWSMPHLVSTKENKGARSTPTSPNQRSSLLSGAHDLDDQGHSPISAEETLLCNDRPLSPVSSAADSTETIKRLETAHIIERMLAGEVRDSIPTADPDFAGDPTVAIAEDPSHQGEAATTAAAEATGAPVSYLAIPKIMIHKPSSSSYSGIHDPRTIDQVLASERQAETLTAMPPIPIDPQTPECKLPDLDSVSSGETGKLYKVPIGVAGYSDASKALKQKKRVAYKWKARNLAARETILKATLGRQLAGPTKQILRSLAKGEPVPFDNLDIVA
ncbi:hypothetical protein P7C71_g43, partial [Lecanoromycetidae sp. Uapishka_2]